MDLTCTHGNGHEKIHVHLTPRIRYAHGLDMHTWKRSFIPHLTGARLKDDNSEKHLLLRL